MQEEAGDSIFQKLNTQSWWGTDCSICEG
jgi:hypothetical protein